MTLVAGSYERFLFGYHLSNASLEGSPPKNFLTYPAHQGPVLSMACCGALVVSGGSDDTFHTFDLSQSRDLGSQANPAQGAVTAVALFAPPGRVSPQHLLTGASGGEIAVWARSGRRASQPWTLVRRLRGHGASVTALALHPGGQAALSAAADGSLKAWDLGSGKATLSVRLEGAAPQQVSFSPDGTRYAVVAGAVVTVADLAGGVDAAGAPVAPRELRLRHPKEVLCAAFADADVLLTGCEGGCLTGWDLETGADCFSLPAAHERRVRALALLPRGAVQEEEESGYAEDGEKDGEKDGRKSEESEEEESEEDEEEEESEEDEEEEESEEDEVEELEEDAALPVAGAGKDDPDGEEDEDGLEEVREDRSEEKDPESSPSLPLAPPAGETLVASAGSDGVIRVWDVNALLAAASAAADGSAEGTASLPVCRCVVRTQARFTTLAASLGPGALRRALREEARASKEDNAAQRQRLRQKALAKKGTVAAPRGKKATPAPPRERAQSHAAASPSQRKPTATQVGGRGRARGQGSARGRGSAGGQGAGAARKADQGMSRGGVVEFGGPMEREARKPKRRASTQVERERQKRKARQRSRVSIGPEAEH